MKRLIFCAAILTAVAFSLGRPAHADGGPPNPECLGDLCGAPHEGSLSLWDSFLSWLGLE